MTFAATRPDEAVPGPTNSLHDVAGLRVGHDTRREDGWLTGTTVVLAGTGGSVGGVDVRGGGPGTRETDLLDPRNVVERVHAVVMSGGSAFGLAAADGVMEALYADGVGFPMGGPGEVVPIVPSAVIYDLGRGGVFANRPDASFGMRAYRAASAADVSVAPEMGVVGAGTGAVAGGFKGGVGSASVVLPGGTTVAALVVVNPLGAVLDPATGELLAGRYLLPADLPAGIRALRTPQELELGLSREAAARMAWPLPLRPALATTIAVVATDATLTKAQCQKLAGVAHDGMARAIRPVHTMFDGDTVFALSTTAGPAPDPWAFHALLEAGGDVMTRAIGRAVLVAQTVTTPAGSWRGYLDVFWTAGVRG
ncbi:MAG: P1 family peptidase [Austwickia sp.]|nr:P1 family peptidase [Austwickia sp.]MBK9101357.1 P1 family peptidase [Austwickia sp.]